VTTIVLKAGHVQPVWAGHPWIFAQGIEQKPSNLADGAFVSVQDARGNILGSGLFSKNSAIAVRIFSRNPEDVLDRPFLVRRFQEARERRELLGLPGHGAQPTDSYRLVFGEGDRLPGLIVDRLGDSLAIQVGTIGMAQRREMILDALEEVYGPRAILDRTSEQTARSEGFSFEGGVVRGVAPDVLTVIERGLRFSIPLAVQQKTGFYFDQRPLRARIEALSRGSEVLDAYSFVGPLGLSAKRGGARRVVSVDSSRIAVEAGEAAAKDNGLDVEFIQGDAEAYLGSVTSGFDLVSVDPPKFARNRAGQDKAVRAFRRLAGLAARAVRPGGLVVISSCSAHLGLRELERALALGARDSGRDATVLERVFQGPDHPVPAAFPEGLYLTSLIAEVR
jgi:23S rRNA (cytosine1962-C5)-methyltransferase